MNEQRHVWVIDDDQSIRWVMERALQQAQFEVSSFVSADEALAALGAHAPDAIVTDIRMPGTDGLGFLQRLQSDHPQTPVIIRGHILRRSIHCLASTAIAIVMMVA